MKIDTHKSHYYGGVSHLHTELWPKATANGNTTEIAIRTIFDQKRKWFEAYSLALQLQIF